MKKLKLKVILGSTREGRYGENVAKWTMKELASSEVFEAELLDLRDYNIPYYDNVTPASMLKAPYDSPITQRWSEKISEADAYIIVTPEYNHGYPAVLKSALDVIYHEWSKKPVAFISYGASASGARAIEQLRQVVAELQMVSIREAISLAIFSGEQIFNEDGEMVAPTNSKKLTKLVGDLYWWASALAVARSSTDISKN